MTPNDLTNVRIALVGLGYVGLPLAVEFGKKYPTVGFDIKPERIAELKAGRDSTRKVEPEECEHEYGVSRQRLSGGAMRRLWR